MPCYDYQGEQEKNEAVGKITILKERLDKRTDMLCRVLKFIENYDKNSYDSLPDDVLKWHSDHKEFDKRNGR